jgi:two-component system sensor histidine kinase/response regulator
MQELAAAGKNDEAVLLAHSIKGAAGNIGAQDLQGAAGALEKWFKEGGQGLPEPGYQDFSRELTRAMVSLAILEEKKAPETLAAEKLLPLPLEVAQEIAQRLRNAVEAGDVTELGVIAGELQDRHDGGKKYGEEIQRLTEDFEFDKISKLADKLAC